MSEQINEQKHLETVREESLDDSHINLESSKLVIRVDDNVKNELATEKSLSPTTEVVKNCELNKDEYNELNDNTEKTIDFDFENKFESSDINGYKNVSLEQSSIDNLLLPHEVDDDNEFTLMNKQNENVSMRRSFSPVNEEENIFNQEIVTQITEDNNTETLNDNTDITTEPDNYFLDNNQIDIANLENTQFGSEILEPKDYYQEINHNETDEITKLNDWHDNEKLEIQNDNTKSLEEDNLNNTHQIAVKVDSENEEIIEDSTEIEEEKIKKKILLDKYKDELSMRNKLQEKNLYLQTRISELLAAKKLDENNSLKYFESKVETDQRYLQYIAQLDNLRLQMKESNNKNQDKLQNLSTECTDKQQKILQLKDKCSTIKNQILNQVVGWGYNKDELEQSMNADERRLTDLEVLRLENIKLNNKIQKKNEAVKAKDDLAKGLHMIDYEQLKIENQTYNEKIEERNEEIENLKKRIASCVQKLSHLQLKVEFLEHENESKKGELQRLDETLAKRRSELSLMKHVRDKYRFENEKLKRDAGLLNRQDLLENYAEYKDSMVDLSCELENLKARHAELTLQLQRNVHNNQFSMPHLNTMS